MSKEFVVLADFNERDAAGRVLVLVEDASGAKEGSRVLVSDSEGNAARGEVVSISEGLARVKVDWNSWRAASGDAVPVSTETVLLLSFTDARAGWQSAEGDIPDMLAALRQRVRTTGGSVVGHLR